MILYNLVKNNYHKHVNAFKKTAFFYIYKTYANYINNMQPKKNQAHRIFYK